MQDLTVEPIKLFYKGVAAENEAKTAKNKTVIQDAATHPNNLPKGYERHKRYLEAALIMVIIYILHIIIDITLNYWWMDWVYITLTIIYYWDVRIRADQRLTEKFWRHHLRENIEYSRSASRRR